MIVSCIQPGTISFEVLAYLREEDCEQSTSNIAIHIGRDSQLVMEHLNNSRRLGVFIRRKADKDFFWSIAPEFKAVDAPDANPQMQRNVDVSLTPSIFAYAAQRMAAPFSVATSSDGRVLIERRGRLVLEINATEAEIMASHIAKKTHEPV